LFKRGELTLRITQRGFRLLDTHLLRVEHDKRLFYVATGIVSRVF
jgi:hypothetical protein